MKGLVQLVCVKLRARERRPDRAPLGSQRNLAVVRLIYREIEMALWALGVALVFYFLIFALPKMPETRIRTELLRIQEINAENERFCQTLRMTPKTPMHDECILALGRLRQDIENRFALEHEF